MYSSRSNITSFNNKFYIIAIVKIVVTLIFQAPNMTIVICNSGGGVSVDISNGNPGEHFTKKRYHKLFLSRNPPDTCAL